MTLFFASHLLIFYALGSAGVSIGIAFYIWIGVFNMVAVAQFWAFANDLYTNERGKRLFPLVGIGASLGALVGAGLTSYFFKGIGPFSLMLVAAFGLTVPVALTIVVHRREGTRPDAKKEEADKPVGGRRRLRAGVQGSAICCSSRCWCSSTTWLTRSAGSC